ncbi:MAG: 4'-phosphopantetheinyl transferase superfamily protein [Oscillospiraceae bacterium]|jgi:phosphopantetheinyl transferase|nr:4'-phosphopantetheinyl transferase superfamily protein [Oscillospiraceae bacterium]
MILLYGKSDEPKTFSRELLKQALLVGYGVTNAELLHGECGEPLLTTEGLYVSISHCKSAAAVVVASAPCGVDIETDRPFHSDIAARFCTERELTWLSLFDGDAYRLELLKLWTKKESVFKQTGVAMKDIEVFKSPVATLHRGEFILSYIH